MAPFLLAALAAASAPLGGRGIIGTWINPAGTVVVTTRRCGPNICGRVVWASARAQEKARAGGTARLVGTELLRDYRPVAPGQWEGQVFVPDRGATVDSQMTQLDRDTLQI